MSNLFSFFLVLITLFALVQSILFLYAMIYAWIRPDYIKKSSSPSKFLPPRLSFTVLLPARHEEKVIADTIKAVSKINYPEAKKQVLVILRSDDTSTIDQANQAIKLLQKNNIKTVVFDDLPINKPHGLNQALPHAKNDVLVIFDAEDEPHSDIFNIVNTVMLRDGVDVVQSGVQLMNFRTSWFSALNVLEYFFWFKSVLHLFSRLGVTPLGGNTVFFRRHLIEQIGGWDDRALTEDAEIGINLSSLGAKIGIVYDAPHATQEETPTDTAGFIKQRTRWDQGFLQVLFKNRWRHLHTPLQKTLAAYLLAWPEIQALYFLYLPFSLLTVFFLKLPVALALFTTLPLLVFFVMFVVLNVGLYEFTQDYQLDYPWWFPLKIILTFFPYQILLGISAVRAVIRHLSGNLKWEKTTHLNLHRHANQPDTVS